MNDDDEIPLIDLQIESFPVVATTRKLKTRWTVEAAQDLKAMHNIDVERFTPFKVGDIIRDNVGDLFQVMKAGSFFEFFEVKNLRTNIVTPYETQNQVDFERADPDEIVRWRNQYGR